MVRLKKSLVLIFVFIVLADLYGSFLEKLSSVKVHKKAIQHAFLKGKVYFCVKRDLFFFSSIESLFCKKVIVLFEGNILKEHCNNIRY